MRLPQEMLMELVLVLFGLEMSWISSVFVGRETRSTPRCQEAFGGVTGPRGRRLGSRTEVRPRNSGAGTARAWWDHLCGVGATGIIVRSVCTRGAWMGGRRGIGRATAGRRWSR